MTGMGNKGLLVTTGSSTTDAKKETIHDGAATCDHTAHCGK